MLCEKGSRQAEVQLRQQHREGHGSSRIYRLPIYTVSGRNIVLSRTVSVFSLAGLVWGSRFRFQMVQSILAPLWTSIYEVSVFYLEKLTLLYKFISISELYPVSGKEEAAIRHWKVPAACIEASHRCPDCIRNNTVSKLARNVFLHWIQSLPEENPCLWAPLLTSNILSKRALWQCVLLIVASRLAQSKSHLLPRAASQFVLRFPVNQNQRFGFSCFRLSRAMITKLCTGPDQPAKVTYVRVFKAAGEDWRGEKEGWVKGARVWLRTRQCQSMKLMQTQPWCGNRVLTLKAQKCSCVNIGEMWISIDYL